MKVSITGISYQFCFEHVRRSICFYCPRSPNSEDWQYADWLINKGVAFLLNISFSDFKELVFNAFYFGRISEEHAMNLLGLKKTDFCEMYLSFQCQKEA